MTPTGTLASAPLPGPATGLMAGLSYGALGLPLAFVALPLYVLLPDHYSRSLGVPLASLGLLLLAARALDALADPFLGSLVDRRMNGRLGPLALLAAGAALLLALCFQGLFFPPVQGTGPLLAWCGLMLAGCYLGYSLLTVLHQSWGARLGGLAPERARIVAWREGLALAGVITASVLPSTAGLQATAVVLAITLALGLLGLARAPRPEMRPASTGPASSPLAPLRHGAFRRLLVIYLLNGVASALPATLVLFFIRDRLQAERFESLFLGLYFLAAALSLPLWVRAVARFGLARCWLAGMGLAILSFVWAASLGSGAVLAFALICLGSGVALGADLCVPPALLAGWLRRQGEREGSEDPTATAGASFGWWAFATKLNLALAAGIGLPLLQALGYQPGAPDPQGLQALALLYGGLPCLLKALAALALWRLWMTLENDT